MATAVRAENIVHKLLAYLEEQEKLHLLPKIVFLLQEKVREREQSGEIISAVALTPEQIATAERILERRLKQKVRLKNRVEKKILGGLIIRFKDLVIDESLLGRLRQLKEELNQL